MKPKSIEQRFKKLTDVEHVLIRPGRYIGSIKPHTATTWVPAIALTDKLLKDARFTGIDGRTYSTSDLQQQGMAKLDITYNPGLLKLFDEIISNSVDHSKRAEGKHLDSIRVEIDRATGEIGVMDNGGFPIIKHAEHNEWIPEMVLGSLRAGENFDDSDDTAVTGQNGEGAALTNIFSTAFKVESSDGKKRFMMKWSDNMHKKSEAKITSGEKGFTRITFTPDYKRLETSLDDGNYAKLVKRIYDVAGCNPKLKVYLNGQRIHIRSFKDYIELYQEEFEYDESDDGTWQIGVAHSDVGFEHISFVNSTVTNIGGTHIDYVANQIANGIREFIQRRHKVDVKPAAIREHLRIFINAVIVRPRYSSQTKDDLITEVKEYGTKYLASDIFIKKLTKSKAIQSILDWAEAKALVEEKALLKDMNKAVDKTNPKTLPKLEDAILAGKKPELCVLFLCEGDSAAKVGKGTGDKDCMGFFALKGVPLNVRAADVDKIKANKEFQSIMIATGLKIGVEVKKPSELRYGRICMMSDADHDGSHITGLHMANLHHYWPELFKFGMIYRFITPVVKVTSGKESMDFYTMKEYEAWQHKNDGKKFTMRYFKGLSSSKDEHFKSYWTNIEKHLVQMTMKDVEDAEMLDLVFGKEADDADRRKVWLDIEDK